MSYQALYRKYRPKTFEDVVGQEHIVKTLINQITGDRISHAYLFCGTRGTGKTSTAKIFAKAINCTDRQNGEPCLKCKTCLEVSEQKNMNIFELDAASNTGVDDVRELRDELKYPPAEGKYKVYIIDEIHMFSNNAFNAFLKTLEEPPEHVIFILATTDPQKIPPTILSRVQRFDFKRITAETMSLKLKKIVEEEKAEIEDNALKYIAYLSDGALRDAISILDQCMTFYFNEKITLEKVQETVGTVDRDIFYRLAGALKNFNQVEALSIVDEMIINGKDVGQFVSEFITQLRNMLLSKTLDKDILDISIDNFEKLKNYSKDFQTETLVRYINIFSDLSGKIKYASNPRINLEVALIKVCNPQTEDTALAYLDRIEKLEKLVEGGKISFNTNTENTNMKEEKSKTESPPLVKKIEKSVPADIEKAVKDYPNFKALFRKNTKLRGFLDKTSMGYLDKNVLYFITENQGIVDLLKNDREKIEKKLIEKYEKEFVIEFISNEEFQKRHKNLYGKKDEVVQNSFVNEIKSSINFSNIVEK